VIEHQTLHTTYKFLLEGELCRISEVIHYL